MATIKQRVLNKFRYNRRWSMESLAEDMNIGKKQVSSAIEALHNSGELTVDGATRSKSGRACYIYRSTSGTRERDLVKAQRNLIRTKHYYGNLGISPHTLLQTGVKKHKVDRLEPFSENEDDYGLLKSNKVEVFNRLIRSASQSLYPLKYEEGLCVGDIQNNLKGNQKT